MQPPAADKNNNLKADKVNDSDEVNLDGISDRGNYGVLRESFKLVDKFSTFNHLGPGAPVPITDPMIEPALRVTSPGFQCPNAALTVEAPKPVEC